MSGKLQVMLVIMIVGAVIGYSQTLDDIAKPLKKSIESYDINENSTDKKNKTITEAWNQVQLDVSFNQRVS